MPRIPEDAEIVESKETPLMWLPPVEMWTDKQLEESMSEIFDEIERRSSKLQNARLAEIGDF